MNCGVTMLSVAEWFINSVENIRGLINSIGVPISITTLWTWIPVFVWTALPGFVIVTAKPRARDASY